MDEWADRLTGEAATPVPVCDWKDERERCRAAATWQVRCAPRRAGAGRGAWPSDIDVLRACARHLGALTKGRLVLGSPTPLGEGGAL